MTNYHGTPLIFMGTPDIAADCLRALIDDRREIAMVFTQPPRPAGRGKKLIKTLVHQLAEARNLNIHCPENLRDPVWADRIANSGAKLGVVVAYGLILPRHILTSLELGFINVHASLLPRWRGAAPIERAILAGDSETGIDIMQMEAGLDTGPIWKRATLPIRKNMTGGMLRDQLSRQAQKLLPPTLLQIEKSEIEPGTQLEEGVTYAHKIDKFELRINWHKSADEIDRQIRAFAPAPGAWFLWPAKESKTERVKALMSHIPQTSLLAGKAAIGSLAADDHDLYVSCADGIVAITSLQPAGKKPMPAKAFLASRHFDQNTRLV